ncbi:PIN domain-containing protein [Mycobacterium hubeiense]|uniref:PIN domain-containing protein n=1 Tax=Mycobacterium hubeiense TaxID=1867256 RepID=UPI000C7F1392|nr:PIN domain-containing protein [Mycobacterium sp. QGD 101]
MTEIAASVVDTDVFSVLFIRRASDDPRVPSWRERLTGRRVVISFQTRAEVLAGVRTRGWGERRTAEALQILDRTPTIYPDVEVVDAYATLVADCRKIGHALQDPMHTGDRWIAACAIAKSFGVLAGDAIYQGVPNLSLDN